MSHEMLLELWSLTKAVVPIVISLIALFVALCDRRPHLTLRARKGDWYKLKPTLNKTEVVFRGILEVYNGSARANAIRDYRFWEKRHGGTWTLIESESYCDNPGNGKETECNPTPFALAPYSGATVHVLAITKMPQPYEMQVRIAVEDLFGKRYQVEVKAVS